MPGLLFTTFEMLSFYPKIKVAAPLVHVPQLRLIKH